MQRRLIVLSFLVVLGCKRSEAPSNRPAGNGDPVVATFADHRVTASEFQRYFNDQSPFVRSHYGSAEGRKSVLEVMIQTELLADQALKEGYDIDDEVVEQYRKAINLAADKPLPIEIPLPPLPSFFAPEASTPM